ncbi:MAG: hypothetical protein ACK53L_28215, partial [Pirellulaceae bacterium]
HRHTPSNMPNDVVPTVADSARDQQARHGLTSINNRRLPSDGNFKTYLQRNMDPGELRGV